MWNYDDQCVQVWEITQKSVFDALHEITKSQTLDILTRSTSRITRGEGLGDEVHSYPSAWTNRARRRESYGYA